MVWMLIIVTIFWQTKTEKMKDVFTPKISWGGLSLLHGQKAVGFFPPKTWLPPVVHVFFPQIFS